MGVSMTWADSFETPLRRACAKVRIVEDYQTMDLTKQAAHAGLLWIELPAPGPAQRGALAGTIEQAVDEVLERTGAAAPGFNASVNLDNALSDQLYRARLLEYRGLVLHLPSLEGICDLYGNLDVEDSAVVRWWIAAAKERPVFVYIDSVNENIGVFNTPLPLSHFTAEANQLREACSAGEYASTEPGPAPLAAPAHAASSAAMQLSENFSGGSAEAEQDFVTDSESPTGTTSPDRLPEVDEIDWSDEDLHTAGEDLRAEPSESQAENHSSANASAEPVLERSEASNDETADEEMDEIRDTDIDDDDPYSHHSSGEIDDVGVDGGDIDDDDIDEIVQLDETQARDTEPGQVLASRSDSDEQESLDRVSDEAACTENLPDDDSAGNETHEPTTARDRLDGERSHQFSEPVVREVKWVQHGTSATAEPPTAEPEQADGFEQVAKQRWQHWHDELNSASGPKPLAVVERMFTSAYVPLREALLRGLAPKHVETTLQRWSSSFEKSYAEAFDALRVRGKRPTMVLDVPDLAHRIGRLHGARTVQLILVDALRFDLGLRVHERLKQKTGFTAALTERLLLWSALPSTTSTQLELIGKGPSGLRTFNGDADQKAVVGRGQAAATPRRIKAQHRELLKLDLVEAHFSEPGPPLLQRLDAVAVRTADALAKHFETLPARTLAMVFGDHGFVCEPLGDGTGAAVQGGASPDEVFVPAFAWLIGRVH